MKLTVFSIVLDGMPWITKHLPVFQQLKCDWQWIIVHGAAMNNGSTRWCKPQEPRLSNDGTTEYLRHIQDKRITLLESKCWPSKDQMVNAAVDVISEPCVLMEIDSDELWRADQLEYIVEAFEAFPFDRMKFACRYFVGENLITKGRNCYGDMDYEWFRAWRFTPGQRFLSHEPPVLSGEPNPETAVKEFTRNCGLIFDHMAYATEPQVRFKQDWYGRNGEYDGLLEGWRRLQEVKEFPVKLSSFFPQVKGDLPLVVKA